MTKIEETIRISDAEWEIMRVVWTKGQVDATTIEQILGDKMQWKLATIKTLLGRLVKKEALKTDQVGKKFIYSANVREDQILFQATEELFGHICAKKMGSSLAQIIEDVPLTQADVSLLQDVLARKTVVESIACNCIPGQCQC
ncbi:MAG: CopY/TcrY family copper transport repressor [Enterococcus lemanii]|jgi:CopY/TcrY family copper transport repressor